MKTPLVEFLEGLSACQEAIEMAKDYPDFETALKNWPRGDHILWLFRRTNTNDLQRLTLAKAHCANTVRHLMKDKRSTNAIDVAIKFGNGEATRDELNDAAAAAADAAAAYADAAAAYAAYAAADAAAAYVDAAAAYAADAAAAYAADAAYAYANRAAARKANQMATADACRKYLPIEIWNIKNSVTI
jgi:hypothetical protein